MIGKTNNKTQEIKTKKKYIRSLNENITNEDIYKLFGLKTTEYLYQMNSADLKMFEKAKKNKILDLLLYQNLSQLHL